MSSASNTLSTSSNFETLINAALTKYTKQTGKDLRNHPLADRIDSCDSADSILVIFQEQAEAFNEFREGDTKLFKWLKPVVDVLHRLSTNDVLSGSSGLVSSARLLVIHPVYMNTLCPVFSAGEGSLLQYRDPSIRVYLSRYLRPTPCHIRSFQEAKYVRESYDALVDIFECIENFLRRLRVYTEIPLTPEMTEMVIKILVELLSVLALATKQINRGRFSMSVLASTTHDLSVDRGREICKETFRRKGHRVGFAEAR
jgi:hypothetical protein